MIPAQVALDTTAQSDNLPDSLVPLEISQDSSRPPSQWDDTEERSEVVVSFLSYVIDIAYPDTAAIETERHCVRVATGAHRSS